MNKISQLEKGIQVLKNHDFTTQVRTISIDTSGMEETCFHDITMYSDGGRVFYHVHGVGLFQDTRF